jgi:hypothetical protein
VTTIHLVSRKHRRDDIAVWPDGIWAELADVWNGKYNFLSDDYEVVALEDRVRLKALGVTDEKD